MGLNRSIKYKETEEFIAHDMKTKLRNYGTLKTICQLAPVT